MRIFVLFVVLILASASFSNAFAKSSAKLLSLDTATPAEVSALVAEFKAKGEKFSPGPQRRQFLGDADTLLKRLNALQDWSTIDTSGKIVIVNSYESLRARVGDAQARRSAVRCRSVKRVGTHLASTQCKSRADIELQEAQTEHDMRSLQRTDFPPQGGN